MSRLGRAAVRCLTRFAPLWAARVGELDPHQLGRLGEELVARRLRAGGWRIHARRLSTGAGEVDLLASDPHGHGRVCVEVKTRRPTAVPIPRGASEAVRARATGCDRLHLGPRQTRRLLRAAREIGAVRVDLIEVRIDRRGPPGFRHMQGVTSTRRLAH